jgi:hypothetical protein
MANEDLEGAMEPEEGERPGAVLATTDQPVPLDVHEIDDERVPEGMRCLGTFLDGTLVARCAVPPGAADFFSRHGVFAEPRQLVLAAREADPGLRCELYAIVPLPEPDDESTEPEDDAEPWSSSVPSSAYERAVSAAAEPSFDPSDDEEDDGPAMAAVLLGQIVRFQKDRKHPDSLPLETVDVLARIVSGRVVEVVDKVLGDLLGD